MIKQWTSRSRSSTSSPRSTRSGPTRCCRGFPTPGCASSPPERAGPKRTEQRMLALAARSRRLDRAADTRGRSSSRAAVGTARAPEAPSRQLGWRSATPRRPRRWTTVGVHRRASCSAPPGSSTGVEPRRRTGSRLDALVALGAQLGREALGRRRARSIARRPAVSSGIDMALHARRSRDRRRRPSRRRSSWASSTTRRPPFDERLVSPRRRREIVQSSRIAAAHA